MIEIVHRYTSALLYRAADAETIKTAVEMAAAAKANLRGADLYGANLYGANLRGADLRGADLRGADLYGANLYGADLRGADLRGADLRGADLYGADINKYWTTPLYFLLDQPGPIRAYKLVTAEGIGPYNGGINYLDPIIDVFAMENADTDEQHDCGAGINLATLDWCLREWREGYRILIMEFTAADIAAIPIGSNGKFRVRKCRRVGEKNLAELGLIPQDTKGA